MNTGIAYFIATLHKQHHNEQPIVFDKFPYFIANQASLLITQDILPAEAP